MYCINCGVKLADTEAKCPLCGVRVYHPDLESPAGEPLYPQHRYPAPEAASRAAQIVISTLLAIAFFTTIYVDAQTNGEITWSGIASGGILVFYTICILPFWFKRVNAVAYVFCVFAVIAAYLMYIDHVTPGSWFFGFAFPVTAYLGILFGTQAYLLKTRGQYSLVIVGGSLIALGLLMPLMEYLIYVTFQKERFVAWSGYPLISLVLLGAMLIFLSVNRRAREKMEQKFFI